jgi:inorganic pyrophosphatase
MHTDKLASRFIPQTYCGDETAKLCREATGQNVPKGDGDPLDICVLSSRSINRGDVLLNAIPIGGFRMIDGGEADDKIISVIKGDGTMGAWKDITDMPGPTLDLLKHFFLTYKLSPAGTGTLSSPVLIPEVGGGGRYVCV